MLARPFIIKCDSCEELKTVLQSVEEKINELCSSMYSKEPHDDLLYDFGKSVNFINEWKCHTLRCENQEIAKQSFIQNLTEDSVFIVMNWAMKFLQRRFQQLFTGLVLCVVHLGESPNYRSLLKFKGKKGLPQIS